MPPGRARSRSSRARRVHGDPASPRHARPFAAVLAGGRRVQRRELRRRRGEPVPAGRVGRRRRGLLAERVSGVQRRGGPARARPPLGEVAFRVRSPQAALWRAEAFDTFDGTMWTISNRTPGAAAGRRRELLVLPPDIRRDRLSRPCASRRRSTSTRSSPTCCSRRPCPRRCTSRLGGLRGGRYGSIRSPILLDEGIVYSVVSDVPVTEPPTCAGRTRPDPRLEPYLQLPADLPARVGALAHRITAGITTHTTGWWRCRRGPREHAVRPRVPRDPMGSTLSITSCSDADRVLRADRDVARRDAPYAGIPTRS